MGAAAQTPERPLPNRLQSAPHLLKRSPTQFVGLSAFVAAASAALVGLSAPLPHDILAHRSPAVYPVHPVHLHDDNPRPSTIDRYVDRFAVPGIFVSTLPHF
jgi:hypothetical protein